jgi:branched-chain amino acid transport system substrate-binding protein
MVLRLVRLVCAAAVLLASTGHAGSAAEPLTINTVLSLTGQAAFIGTTYAKTLSALEAGINKSGGIKGQPIHFSIQDDQSSAAVAVQLVSGLIGQHVSAIFGPNLAATCRAVAPLLNNGPMEYCLSPSLHAPKGSYMFSVGVDTRDQTAVIVRYLREKGMHNFAMIVTTDASGQDADSGFAEALKAPENRDMHLIDVEHFNVTDPSVSAQLVKIMASKPQAIIAWATGTPMATTLRGIQENAIGIPIIMNNANAVAPQMKTMASVIPPQLYSYGPQYMLEAANSPRADPVDRMYFSSLKAAGVESDYISGLVWDPALIVLDAYRAVGPNATAEQIRDHILGLHNFRGVAGPFDFTDGSQRGLGQDDMMMMRWDAAKNVWVAASKPRGVLR